MIPNEPSLKIATIILAAGQSKRMKAIKQLLPWKASTLLGYAIEESLLTKTDHIFVVLGANKEEILNALGSKEFTSIVNDNWIQGMGTSIAAALRYIQSNQLDYDGILIRLIDQPLLSVKHYNKLIYSYINGSKIASTSYDSGFGVPAVFDKCFFDEILELKSDKGAKEIINRHKEIVSIIDSKGKTIDLDDYETYLNFFNEHGKDTL